MSVKKSNKIKKEKNLNKIKFNNIQGITLIALVITIVVLIILAGVSINLVLGENGLIERAKEAKEKSEQARIDDEVALNEAAEYIDNNGVKYQTVAELKGGEYVDKPTTVKDSNGNLIKIPKGFKIAQDSGINVTEGIVIEDNDIIEGVGNNRGNQYVWIPVGTGIKKADGTTVDITLGRYVFADGTNHKDLEENVLAKGTPILKQNANDYEDETEINIKEIYPTITVDFVFKELVTSRIGTVDTSNRLNDTNTTALNLKGFVDSVKSNGGYYIARYEASYGTDGKANSKISNSFTTNSGSSYAPTTEGALWNNITQLDAAVASRGLYTTATTDLINSYAWDTAIAYIQKFSGDTDYSYQNSKNGSLANTGVNSDEICKINDMASNTTELTTEYSTFTDGSSTYPCTLRGGSCNDSVLYTSGRYNGNATNSCGDISFRSTLYM